MNLKEIANLPAFVKLREDIRRMEADSINALIAKTKANDINDIKVQAGIIEGIQRVEAHIDKEVKRHVDESRRRTA